MRKAAAHEQFDRLPAAHNLSGRTFGIAIALALSVFACSPLRKGGNVRIWALAAAALFLIAAAVRPSSLQPLASLWAVVLRPVNAAVTWLVMGLLFGMVIVPVGIVRRLLVKDPLGLQRDPVARSYWKPRNPARAPESMANQF